MEVLRKHASKDFLKTAVIRAEEFIKVMQNKQPHIHQRISQALADTIAKNRQILGSIFKTVELCGRQNIALRGHYDNMTDRERDVQGLQNHGNFWALMKFRIEAGDTVLDQHLSSSSRNAMYTSKTIQNQIIDILGDQIRQKILEQAKWFTIIADEVTDLSNKEIMCLVLRYVDQASELIREDFIGFLECDTGTTGRSLANKITSNLQSYSLDLKFLRGQAYGAVSVISSEYPLALYLHCASHSLNLTVVKSLELTSVRNMMGVISKASFFFDAHPKRQRALEKAIEETQPDSKVSKLKDLCRTRWVQRIDVFIIFQSLHPSIAACF